MTAHGTAMGYVLTTFFIMGFGYYVAETALERPLPGIRWAWIAYGLGLFGTAMAVLTILSGRASVLYTFYPPLTASVFFYLGLVLVVVGSWIWCVEMIVAMAIWKRANPGKPVPLAMFATVANAVMWLWTTAGVAVELLFLVIPAALGWRETIDVGLTRTLFSWTLHAIVYFWLFPAYIAFYTMAPRAAGGRLYSDTMGRLSFVLFLVYSLPVGLHHLFMDPEHSTGFKFVQMSLTALVTVPTLLTIFTDPRLARDRRPAARRQGPVRLDRRVAVARADGARDRARLRHAVVRRRRRAHQHELFDERHGPQHVMGHGAFPSDLRRHGGDHVFRHRLRDLAAPHRAGRARPSARMRAALAVGDRHDGDDDSLALAGPRRPVAPRRPFRLHRSGRSRAGRPGSMSRVIGGLILLASACLFIWNLARFHSDESVALDPMPPQTYALAVHPPSRVPAPLNGFALWNVVVLVLMLTAYGYPIAQSFILSPPQANVHRVSGAG